MALSRFDRSGRRRLGAVALVAAAGLIAASCGSDEKAAPETAAPAAETTAAPAAAETTAAPAAPAGDGKSVTDYVGYFGGSAGKAADAAMAPIKIGYVNQEGGPVVIGGTHDDGADIAVKFVNENGGIGGHPVELVKCYIAGTEEDGQKCGQDLANDDGVVSVVVGAVAFGAESFYAALGDKPSNTGVSVNPVDLIQANGAVLYGGAQYILAPYGTFARDVLKVKSAALVYPEGAGADLPATGQADSFKAAGIPINVVSFPATATDLTVPLLAAKATEVDLVMPVINPPDCVKFAQAITQLKIPENKVLASPVCLTPTTIEALGDFPKWIYAVGSTQSADPTDPATPPYQDILKGQGQDKFIGDPWVTVGFGQTLTMIKWLNAVGADNLKTDAIVKEMKAFTGPMALGSPALKCGKYAEAPAVCNDYTQFYSYEGNFVFKQASSWLQPPEGWKASA